jgi:NADH dehydrogenase [ubiquinone] 1 alpha subcomplex assembly factor 5
MPGLFDMTLRALRRDRAARQGPELFLLDRTFEDCLDRLSLFRAHFGRTLLVGCANPEWPARLREFADVVDACDPGPSFARSAEAQTIVEDRWDPPNGTWDLIVAIGTLDTVNDLPAALRAFRAALAPGGLILGAFAGADSLPQLRGAMRAGDLVAGEATPHVHPRIEPSALAPLLANAGFVNPVVDIDRVPVSYKSLADLVTDLRRMGATNVLSERSRRPIPRVAMAAAADFFTRSGDGERTTEIFEILHFVAWKPAL